MKKIKTLFLLGMSGALLASCGGGTSIASSQSTSEESSIIESRTSEEITTSEESSSKTSHDDKSEASMDSYSQEAKTSEKVDGITFTFRVQGALYAGSSRAVYLELKGADSNKVTWSSDDASILSASDITSEEESVTAVALVTAKAVGTTRLIATLENGASSSIELTVLGNGQLMSDSLFEQVMYGAKFSSNINFYSYSDSLEETFVESSTAETIYEEYNPETKNVWDEYYEDWDRNETDGYRQEVSTSKKVFNYVRAGRKVGQEYLDPITNTVNAISIQDENGDEYYWDNSYYVNPFNNSTFDLKASDFQSFDEGETYHYCGSYLGPMRTCASLYLETVAPDDMFFTVNEGEVEKLSFIIDPANYEDDSYYGARYEVLISEKNTAKVDHISPRPHLAFHDKIDAALEEIRESRSYKSVVSIDYGSTSSLDRFYYYSVDDSTYDEKVTDKTGNILSHGGMHKDSENSYYSYDYDDETTLVTIKTTYAKSYDNYGYPNFDFASEIFNQVSDTEFLTEEGFGLGIVYCSFLPKDVSLGSYNGQLRLTLDEDGHLKSVSTVGDFSNLGLDETFTITINFSEVGTNVVDIDFTNIDESGENLPKTWQEASPALYNDMVEEGVIDYFPYKYASSGWNDYVAKNKANQTYETEGDAYYITTNAFSSTSERDTYIDEYIAMLLDMGYTHSDKTIAFTDASDLEYYPLYKHPTENAYLVVHPAYQSWGSVHYTNKVEITLYGVEVNYD
ncbi:MAG: hypothetical protein K5694_05535 [Bacilli bacterium]|nr:hypothetical protein [Bacilli bacterium]